MLSIRGTPLVVCQEPRKPRGAVKDKDLPLPMTSAFCFLVSMAVLVSLYIYTQSEAYPTPAVMASDANAYCACRTGFGWTEMKRIKVWGRGDLGCDEFDRFQRGNCGQVGVFYWSRDTISTKVW